MRRRYSLERQIAHELFFSIQEIEEGICSKERTGWSWVHEEMCLTVRFSSWQYSKVGKRENWGGSHRYVMCVCGLFLI